MHATIDPTTVGPDISDPRHEPATNSLFDQMALRMISDERDYPFVKLTIGLSLLMMPSAIVMFWPGLFSWWHAAVHTVVYLYFLGPYILMLHNTSHRRLFPYKFRFLNPYIPIILGPFFGESPETYYAHHIGMHHPENNLADDLSSTMKYDRASFLGFLHYFGRFIIFGMIELPRYFYLRNRMRLLRKTLFWELSYYVFCGTLAYFNWQAALVVFIGPMFLTRLLMMIGNWGQHAFVDKSDPGNPYLNSITCINTGYNKRCFNDGYHIGHHIKPNRHWTEMVPDFEDTKDEYAAQGAIVFEGIDFFMVSVFLFLKRWNWLARRYVKLTAGDKDEAAIVALLKERTRPIR